MDWSLSKIIRIENGAVCISTNDLKALGRLCEIRDSNRTAELIELLRACHQARGSKYRADNSSRFLDSLSARKPHHFCVPTPTRSSKYTRDGLLS